MTSRPQQDTTNDTGASADPPAIEHQDAVAAPPQLSPAPPSQPQSPVQLRQPLISNVLRAALFSAKDRSFIIGLEQDLLAFITSHTDSYLLRPMNSYYRLLTHQTAEYYGLGHTLNKEGNSIVVFKNFGGDPTPPVPLVSLPFDPQQMAMVQPHPQHQQPFMFQQGAAPGPTPGATPGPVPVGYGFAPQYGYPQGMPYGQHLQFNNKYSNNRYQPRHFNNNNNNKHHHHRQAPQPHHNNDGTSPQENATPPDSTEVSEEDEATLATAAATSQIKLMKRSDGEETADSAAPVSKDEPTVESVPKKDAETLANERATRESEYQKARERIFQGEDEIDEDLIDDMERMSIRSQQSPNLPRSLPSQPQHPYGGGYVPANMQHMPPGGIPQQYYYNQGYPQMMMYDPSTYGQQPVYYNQINYNSGGYRKKNYNNGYRNNRNNSHGGNNYNSHRNGGQSGFNEKEKEPTSVNEEVGSKDKEQEESSAPKEDVNGGEAA